MWGVKQNLIGFSALSLRRILIFFRSEDFPDVPSQTCSKNKRARTTKQNIRCMVFDSLFSDIQRKEAQVAGGQSPPPPDVLVDYNYNVAERRSVHVLKTLQEDAPADGTATTSSRGSSVVSGPSTLRRRKKRRKAGSSASDSSGQSSANGTLEPSPGNKYVKVNSATAAPTTRLTAVAKAGALPPRDPGRTRPKSATLVRERPAPDDMEAQQHLMQPRTPPLYGAAAYRQQPLRQHRRVLSSSNNAALDEQPQHANLNMTTGVAPATYTAPDGRVYMLPVVHKGRADKRYSEGPVIPLDPRKDVLADIEGKTRYSPGHKA